MVKFDITDYLVSQLFDEPETDGSDMIQWLRQNVGDLDAAWLDAHKIKAEDITNSGRGHGWAVHAHPNSPYAAKSGKFKRFTWIVELADDTAAMQFKLIWPQAKILNEQV